MILLEFSSRDFVMDILRPPLVYIGNRCYRKNPVTCAANTVEDDYEDDELGYRDGMPCIIHYSIQLFRVCRNAAPATP